MTGQTLRISGWDPLRMRLTREDLHRHVLALGESGSGKTRSVILPVLDHLLGTEPAHTRPSALILDPKDREISAFLSGRLGPEGLRVISPGEGRWRIGFFVRGTTGERLAPHEIVDALVHAHSESPASGARNEGFWIAAARRMILGLVAADHWLAANRGIDAVRHSWESIFIGSGAEGLPEENRGADGGDVRRLWQRGGYADILVWAISRAMASPRFLRTWASDQAGRGCPWDLCDATASLAYAHPETVGAIGLTAQNILEPLTLAATQGHLWTTPYFEPEDGSLLDPTALMDDGVILAYAPPRPSMASDTLGRAIKRGFFHAALRTRDRSRGFVYCADEFQRVITADPTTGEASFLDRARSYGVICILATQSEAALRYALGADGNPRGEAAVQVILSNVATRLCFRSTDPAIQGRLRALIPGHPTDPSRPHVLDVRPLSSLAAGELYWLSPAGEWGRGRIRLGPGSE
jgi:hypothetical protein